MVDDVHEYKMVVVPEAKDRSSFEVGGKVNLGNFSMGQIAGLVDLTIVKITGSPHYVEFECVDSDPIRWNGEYCGTLMGQEPEENDNAE